MLHSNYMPALSQLLTIKSATTTRHVHAVRSQMLSLVLMLALQGLIGCADGVLPHAASIERVLQSRLAQGRHDCEIQLLAEVRLLCCLEIASH